MSARLNRALAVAFAVIGIFLTSLTGTPGAADAVVRADGHNCTAGTNWDNKLQACV